MKIVTEEKRIGKKVESIQEDFGANGYYGIFHLYPVLLKQLKENLTLK